MGNLINQSNRAIVAAGAAVVFCITLSFLVYWPNLNDYFVYDDFIWLDAVRGHSMWELTIRAFTFPTAQPFDEVTLFWRPLTDLYFYLARIFELHSEPYHVVNVALHGLVGGLAAILVWRLTKSSVGGLVAGALFVVAPTYAFAVSWISQVSEIMGAALGVGALICYHAYLTSEKPRRLYLAVAIALATLAFLSKESSVILLVLFPVLVLAIDPNDRQRSHSEIVRSLVPIAIIGGICAVTMLTYQHQSGNPAYHAGLHMKTNLWNYLKWMVWPDADGPAADVRSAAAIIFLVLGVVALLLRQRQVAFFAFWTIVAIAPFTGWEAGIEHRYTYLATLPFIAFFVAGAVALVRALPPLAARPVAAVFVIAALVALIATPFQARDQQEVLAEEAARYQTMVTSVQELCGPMPPESHVFIFSIPYGDLYGAATPAALNLYYDRLYAARVREYPILAGFIERKCVLSYQQGRYIRIELP